MSRGTPSSSSHASVAVLGSDAVLAALPATPVQLAHACHALGYEVVFPASWGDELVASACLERLGDFPDGPAVLCACPYVAERLARVGDDLAPWLIRLAAPPVAVARYLRSAYGARPVHITYIGACPAATDPSIDARLSPEALFAMLGEHDIVLAEQPELFESVLPPDRRRFHSLPGGAPAPERLEAVDPGRALVELEGDDFLLELSQRLLSRERTLIDIAPQLGCACGGVLVAGAAHGARPALVALEPPRAPAPVLDGIPTPEVIAPDDASRPAAAAAPATPGAPTHGAPVPAPEMPGEPEHVVIREYWARQRARRAPLVVPRRAAGGPPALRRRDGVVVPRAFAAHASGTRTPVRADPPERGRGTRVHAEPLETPAARRARRAAHRPRVIPLPSEPPRPVPPPPGKPGPHALLDLGAII
ncbi:MAG TPA: [Fe-Fe] hydrogenase large subunit C-terminal domain-containing protein [Gemmatimonadaceae bacterium]|nr:[Fe-Fe] hydrogenase large subunit C-terminal domain-containing protein [Gemmatimonadaceae bacterium]